MAKLKLLFITYYYPPDKCPRSIQIAHLAKVLKNDFEIKILTVKPSVQEDPSLLEFTELDNVTYIRESKLSQFIQQSRGDRYKQKLLPDQYFFSHFDFVKSAQKLIQEFQPKVIITFGQPMSLHVAGLKLKKAHKNLKWIAHFSDPWVDNLYNNYNSWKRWINSYYEKKVFEYADKLIFTSSDTIKLIENKCDSDQLLKLAVVPHCFNPDLFNCSSAIPSSSSFIIRYLGNFYGNRQPDPLFEALKLFPQNLLNTLKIELFCSNPNTIIDKIQNYQLDSIVKCLTPVSYLESLKLMEKSDLLLIIDAPANSSPFLPSKLIDYIGANKPIFGITPMGTSKTLIQEMNFECATPSNPALIATKLSQFIIDIKENRIKNAPESIRTRFINTTIRNEVSTLIKKLC